MNAKIVSMKRIPWLKQIPPELPEYAGIFDTVSPSLKKALADLQKQPTGKEAYKFIPTYHIPNASAATLQISSELITSFESHSSPLEFL